MSFAALATAMTDVIAEQLWETGHYTVPGQPPLPVRVADHQDPQPLPGAAPGRENRHYLSFFRVELDKPERGAIVSVAGQTWRIDSIRSRDQDVVTAWAQRL